MQLVAHVGHRRLVHDSAVLGIDDGEEVGLVDAGALVHAGEIQELLGPGVTRRLRRLVERGGGAVLVGLARHEGSSGSRPGVRGRSGWYSTVSVRATISLRVIRSASWGWSLRRCCSVRSTSSSSVSPRTIWPHSHVICLAMGWVSRAIVGSAPFAYVGGKVGARLERADNTYVQLCGRFVVELYGRRVEQRFPSRQGRVLFASLVLDRPRAVGRHELIEAIWAGDLTASHASALTVLLSKLRAAVGSDVLAGRGSVRVALPADARVDVEQALAALHRAAPAA